MQLEEDKKTKLEKANASSGEPPKLNKPLWISTVTVILGLTIFFMFFPDQSSRALNAAMSFCVGPLGWVYLWGCFACFALTVYFGFGRLGRIKFGGPDAKPDFSFMRWVAMVFFGSCGTSTYYWATIEWSYYYKGGTGSTPFDIVPGTWNAADWASTYSMFHQGAIGWSVYIPFALCIGYMYYNRKVRILRVSEACRPVLGKLVDGSIGKAIDFFVIFGMIGGLVSSFGFAAPFVANAICFVVGAEYSFTWAVFYQLAISIAQSVVLWLGLRKGSAKITGIVNYLMYAFLGYVLLTGPTAFIISQFSTSFGNMIANFTKMAFWTDAVGGSGFPQAWTIFFFAWWVTFAPTMGIFIAKISKGRTMGQTAVSMVAGGCIGVWLPYTILGNFAMNLDVTGKLPVSDMIMASDGSAGAAANIIIQVLQQLPLSFIVIPALIALCFISSTTATAATVYSFAASTTKSLDLDVEPARWNRVFWVWLTVAIGISVQVIGGVGALKTASTVSILPLFAVLIVVIMSLFKMLKEDGLLQNDNIIYAPMVKGETANAEEEN